MGKLMNDASSPVIENASADHPDVEFGKIGVLLINLGTPDSTDPASLRRYLGEFLTDRRVIEWPRWLWCRFMFEIGTHAVNGFNSLFEIEV
ncbi:hypothetical protein BG36_18645 [Aquamicrobium defluvii]|uniref:Ferrochelatase n=1 Tax=Aquamicrobium defluvii TaxID=69279 RepID=A0A011UZI4_9HYPH|nr:hypothetical protein BG36_18645 [Aquamicrobium defluvii]EZQ12774.1 hypothetical protein CF98_34320 [Halopseudomonas bauzanensis]